VAQSTQYVAQMTHGAYMPHVTSYMAQGWCAHFYTGTIRPLKKDVITNFDNVVITNFDNVVITPLPSGNSTIHHITPVSTGLPRTLNTGTSGTLNTWSSRFVKMVSSHH